MFVPVRIVVPVPSWLSVPEPAMLPESVCTFAPVLMPFTAPLSVTLFVKVSPFRSWMASVAPTFTVVETEFAIEAFAATPLPICSVPNATVVAPPYVFVAVKIVVPAPCCRSVPVPLIRLPTVITSLRLKTSAPLSVTEFVPRLPAAPPAPICKVPAVIVVTPL